MIEILDGAIKDEGRPGVQTVAEAIGRLDIKAPPALVADMRGRLHPAAGSRPVGVETGIPFGMQSVKKAALADLKDVQASQLTTSLQSLRESYAGWLQRMQQLLSF